MKRYRQGYDYLFLPNKYLIEKNEMIGALCICVLIKVFDKSGNEIVFETENEPKEQRIKTDKRFSKYLSDFFECSFNKDNLFSFAQTRFVRNSKFTISYEIHHYDKNILKDSGLVPEFIEKVEFENLFRKNIALFDNPDNYSAQTTSWFWEEVKAD